MRYQTPGDVHLPRRWVIICLCWGGHVAWFYHNGSQDHDILLVRGVHCSPRHRTDPYNGELLILTGLPSSETLLYFLP